jgi:hypothetical protein
LLSIYSLQKAYLVHALQSTFSAAGVFKLRFLSCVFVFWVSKIGNFRLVLGINYKLNPRFREGFIPEVGGIYFATTLGPRE